MAYFTFTLNGHEYTSDPANVTAADGYRFIGYGYIPALGNLAIDLVALATGVASNKSDVDEATEIAVTAAGEADEARDEAVAAAVAATSAAQGLQGTSATALTPGLGNKVFVTQAGKQFPLNHNIVAVSASDANVFIYGTVGAYAGTGLTIACTAAGTATEKSDWVIAVSGVRGPQGIEGPQGEDAEVRSLVQARSANGTITAADLGATLRCTDTITLDPDPAATLGNGFSTLVDAPGHAVTVDGVGTVPVGGLGLVQSDGTTVTLRLLGGVSSAPVASVTATAAAAALLNTGLDGAADVYDLVVSGVTSVNNAELRMRFELGGSVVSTSTYQYTQSSDASTLGVSSTAGSGAPSSYVPILNCGNGASNSFTLTLRITRPANTAITKLVTWRGASVRTEISGCFGNAMNQGTGALTGIQLFADSGTITCTMRLYAVPNA
ncbi:MAG: hypothetical protein LCH79_07835 [Proteobacteria bacterium]|nr:hypothetical protein [Pseudomonadota bacterium]